VVADPGSGPFARVLAALPVSSGTVPYPLILIFGVLALLAAGYWWQTLGWLAIPIYVVLLGWVALRTISFLTARRGHITIRNHICTRCGYKWTDSLSDRQMQIKRFRWEVDSARKRGDKKTLAMALSSLGGLIAMYGEDLREARQYVEESLDLRREMADPARALTLNNLAFILYYLDHVETGRPLAEESVAMLREQKEWNGVASALNTLGFLQLAEGAHEQAKASFREGLLMQFKKSDWESVAWNLEGLAGVAAAEGDDERAVRLFSAAAVMRDEGRYVLLAPAKRDQEEKLEALRDRMGQIKYADAWGVGRSMTPEQAAAYGMGETGLPSYLTDGPGGGPGRAVLSRLNGGFGVVLAVGAGFAAFLLTGSLVGGGGIAGGDGSVTILEAATPVTRTDSATGYKFDVFADEFQFYLEDSNPTGSSSSPLFWSEEAFARRLAVLGDIMAVGTARSIDVPVEVWVRKGAPGDNFEGWDHVVEGSLRVASGKLVLSPPLDFPETYMPVEPGTYRVRVYMGALASADAGGVEGEDYYRIEAWLAPYDEPRLLKEWVGNR
jgi:hypothetical protein